MQFANVAEHLDVLVNNAGIYPDKGVNILTVPREHMERTFQTNTFGALEVTQAFVPLLRKAARRGWLMFRAAMGNWMACRPTCRAIVFPSWRSMA